MARVRIEVMDLCRMLERDPTAEQPPLVIGEPSASE